MATFLLKTEPGEFSFADMVKAKASVWSGVSNNQALIFLRVVRPGDQAFIYHTGDERAIVGLARFTTGAYADPVRPGLNGKGEPRFAVADLEPVMAAKTPVTLDAIKGDARFAEFALVKQPRLSVMPVPETLAKALRSIGGLR